MVARPAPGGLGKLAERALAAAAAAMAAAGLSKDGAKDEPGTRTQTADCSQTPQAPQCNQCKLVNGRVGQPPTPRFITRKNRINYDYQLQIANMYAAPEQFGYVERGDNSNTLVNIDLEAIKSFFGRGGKFVTLEWIFAGVAFDGFWRSRCTVVEAKGNFKKFFNEDGSASVSFARFIPQQWSLTCARQAAVIAPTKPQGKLEWHFMQVESFNAGLLAGIPPTIARLTPYVLGSMP